MYEKLRSSYITPISLYPRTFLEYKAEYPRTCSLLWSGTHTLRLFKAKILTVKSNKKLLKIIGGIIKMIKEKYIPLLLSHQIGGITTIGDTHTLANI